MILPFTDKEPPLSEVLEQSIPSFVAKKAQMLRVTAGTLLFSELEKHLIAAEASQLAPEITISVLGLEKGEKFGDDTIEKGERAPSEENDDSNKISTLNFFMFFFKRYTP